MNGFIKYNNIEVFVEKIDGKKCIPFIRLCALAQRNPAYFYKKLAEKKLTLADDIIKKAERKTYLTLEVCIKFLSLIYMPEDGLIKVIKDELNGKPVVNIEPKWYENEKSPTMVCSSSSKPVMDAEKFVDVELDRVRMQKVKDDLKERDKEHQVYAIYKVVKDIDIRLLNLECKVGKIYNELTKCRDDEGKCDQSEHKQIKGFVKDLIKEIISEVLNG